MLNAGWQLFLPYLLLYGVAVLLSHLNLASVSALHIINGAGILCGIMVALLSWPRYRLTISYQSSARFVLVALILALYLIFAFTVILTPNAQRVTDPPPIFLLEMAIPGFIAFCYVMQLITSWRLLRYHA